MPNIAWNHNNIYVSKEQLKARDLVFFGKLTSTHHVSRYIGNRQMIHNLHTGNVIKVSNLETFPQYITARRVK